MRQFAAVTLPLVAFLLAASATPAWASDRYTLVVAASSADRSSSVDYPDGTGMALYPSVRLATPVNTFSASVAGVDIRGQRPDGTWTEWTPDVLPTPAFVVQARLAHTGPAGDFRLDLWSGPPPSNRTAMAAHRVFATREGLVGGTTANGHVIKSRDHFAALPSRRGLSPKGSGSYTVKVCAASGRCAWAPVWDVGPWNTRDDYWNPTRQEWHDLPTGKPQAQAAYQDNYNNGRDQFGRAVANPAGIDLGDGTFWDGLRLSGNAWVTVTYLWTSSGPYGYVRTPGDTLNVRDGTTSDSAVVGLAGHHAQVRVECETVGETIGGSQGTSDVWLRIAPGKYVAKAFVSGVSGAPTC
jgi:hypothetical protein